MIFRNGKFVCFFVRTEFFNIIRSDFGFKEGQEDLGYYIKKFMIERGKYFLTIQCEKAEDFTLFS